MLLSKEQLSSVMAKHSERENGLHDLMEIMIESMMLAERREFLDHAEGNKGNGFRHGRAFGQGRVLEFRIPATATATFTPRSWRCFATRRWNANAWPASFTARG